MKARFESYDSPCLFNYQPNLKRELDNRTTVRSINTSHLIENHFTSFTVLQPIRAENLYNYQSRSVSKLLLELNDQVINRGQSR